MNIRNLILGIAIFVLTISVGIYGIRTFHGPGPKYEDYCYIRPINTQEQCSALGGTWIPYTYSQNTEQTDSQRQKPLPPNNGYCELNYTDCQKDFENSSSIYSKKVFLTALPLGVILIVVAAFLFNLEFVSSGLMAGSVGIILYGVIGFWNFANEWLKFLISIIGLVVLIFFSYYYTRRKLTKKR